MYICIYDYINTVFTASIDNYRKQVFWVHVFYTLSSLLFVYVYV